MRVVMHNWMRPEPIEVTIKRLKSLGYDGIQIMGEPRKYDVKEVRALLKKYKLECWGAVTIMVKDATAAFNIKAGRVVGIDWRMSDERQQGPVSPTLSADIGFSLKRTPVQTPAQLSDIALVKVPAGPPPANLGPFFSGAAVRSRCSLPPS